MTDDRYHITTRVGDKIIAFSEPLADPFVRHGVSIGWRDLLHGLVRGRLNVEVTVGADRETVESVLLIDPDYLGRSDSPRRREWNAQLNDALRQEILAAVPPETPKEPT